VLTQLPPKRRQVVLLPTRHDVANADRAQQLHQLLQPSLSSTTGAAAERQTLLLSSFREAGMAKLPGAIAYVQRALEGGEKLVHQ
jgi:hypothetical protein